GGKKIAKQLLDLLTRSHTSLLSGLLDGVRFSTEPHGSSPWVAKLRLERSCLHSSVFLEPVVSTPFPANKFPFCRSFVPIYLLAHASNTCRSTRAIVEQADRSSR